MQRVINFSGGKTSGLMTILLKPTDNDIVLFTDTKREHPMTYKFIDDFEKHEGIKIHRAVYSHKLSGGLEGFDGLIHYKKYVPNRMQRFCSPELKSLTARRYLRKLGIKEFDNYIGFRFDEPKRIKDVDKTNRFKKTYPKFPLYDMGITKEMVNKYWLTKPYTLEIPSILGNCDLCFLKGKDRIIQILSHHPELADKWIKDEELARINKKDNRANPTYVNGISMKQMLNIAQNTKTLFDLEPLDPAFSCSCTSI